jgi:hypothetical protein
MEAMASALPHDARPKRVAQTADDGQHAWHGRSSSRRGPSASPPARIGGTAAREFRRHVMSVVVIVVFLIGIWAAAGGGYFWPVWPALGLALTIGLHAVKLLAPDADEPPSRRGTNRE